MKVSRNVVEDVLVQVDKFYYPRFCGTRYRAIEEWREFSSNHTWKTFPSHYQHSHQLLKWINVIIFWEYDS